MLLNYTGQWKVIVRDSTGKTMAVCRRSRVLKLTLLAVVLLSLLYMLFPDELHDFLKEFAPPNVQMSAVKSSQEHKRTDNEANSNHRDDKIVVMNQHVKHSDSETYLTPGNPGNFEPLRDEEGEGPGEKGVAHHTKAEQADTVDESINEYGK